MKNKLIILLCLTILAFSLFSSCTPDNQGDETGKGECQHPVKAEWSTSETHHWKPTECEHGEFRQKYGEHKDTDEDGLCDDCAYECGHDHTYSSEWSYDLASHWKQATCTHRSNENTSFGLHADTDNNGKCDQCGAHVHVVNAFGKCAVCDVQVKPVDTSNLSNVISAIVGGYSRVNGGNIAYAFNGRSNGGKYSNVYELIEYTLGADSIYVKTSSSADMYSIDQNGNPYYAENTDVTEKWYQLQPDNSVFGAYRESYKELKEDGTYETVLTDVMVDGGASADSIYGYCYYVSTLASGYGAEGVLAELYAKSQNTSASDFLVAHEEGTRTYKFSFNSTIVNTSNTTIGVVTNVNYYEVEVEFSYDSGYSLTNLSIVCDCYTSDAGGFGSGENTVQDTANIDFIYDASTGKITMKEDALADTYTFTVTQTAGERTYESEYPKSYFFPKDFEVYSDSEFTTLCPSTVTVSVGDYARFYLKESGEDGKKFTSAEGITVTSDTTTDYLVPLDFSIYSSQVRFLAKIRGTYTVNIEYEGVVRTFKVIVV